MFSRAARRRGKCCEKNADTNLFENDFGAQPEDDRWIHYLSHELVGLSKGELEEYYFKDDPELRPVLEPILGKV